MRQEDTRRRLVTSTGVLALALASLALALLLWPEALRGLMFSSAPSSPSGERDGWGWLALGWFALVGSWLMLVAVAALILPAVEANGNRTSAIHQPFSRIYPRG